MAHLTVSPVELREKTNTAIAVGKQKRLEQERQAREALRLKAEENAGEADKILRELPSRCQEAAEKGESYVVVMRVRALTDYIEPPGYKKKDPDEILGEWLIGAALLVWTACEAAGFQPFFRFDYSNGGEDSWHNMTLNW